LCGIQPRSVTDRREARVRTGQPWLRANRWHSGNAACVEANVHAGSSASSLQVP
jgi:hypothetical protein